MKDQRRNNDIANMRVWTLSIFVMAKNVVIIVMSLDLHTQGLGFCHTNATLVIYDKKNQNIMSEPLSVTVAT